MLPHSKKKTSQFLAPFFVEFCPRAFPPTLGHAKSDGLRTELPIDVTGHVTGTLSIYICLTMNCLLPIIL